MPTRAPTENGEAALARPDTDPGVRDAMADVADALGVSSTAPGPGQPFVSELVSELLRQSGSGGDEPPPRVQKTLKRHNWAIAIVVGILAPSGIVASYYATKALAESNAAKIEKHEATHDEHHDLIDANSEAVREIKGSVDSLADRIEEQTAQQTQLVESVDELKRENVNRLERERDELRREVRRLRRQR